MSVNQNQNQNQNQNLITENYATLTPAHGRDYKSMKSVIADFVAGKDFVIHTPTTETHCSIRDFAKGVVVNLRYYQQLRLVSFTV